MLRKVHPSSNGPALLLHLSLGSKLLPELKMHTHTEVYTSRDTMLAYTFIRKQGTQSHGSCRPNPAYDCPFHLAAQASVTRVARPARASAATAAPRPALGSPTLVSPAGPGPQAQPAPCLGL